MFVKSFLKYFLTLLGLFSIFRIFDNAINLDSWQYGEWLINYQNGFVRRGLTGELIYFTSYLFNQNIQISFIFILSIIILIYYYLNFKLLKKIELNFLNLLILFSPLFFVFFIIISKVGIKKEIILYIFYLIYLLILLSKNYNYKKNWYIFLFFPMILLIHEGFFFFLPYFLIPLFLINIKENFKSIFFQSSFLFLSSSLIIFVLYINKGNAEFTNVICGSLENFAPDKCTWWGPIAALKTDVSLISGASYYQGIDENEFSNQSKSLFYVFDDFITYLGFIFYILYSFMPILAFFILQKFNKKNLLIFLILSAFIFSLPLFHFAQDWSRWFSMHLHLIAFLVFFLQRLNLININKKTQFYKINNFFMKKFKYVFVLIIFFYCASFHHHHFFHKGVRLELTYIKVLNNIIK